MTRSCSPRSASRRRTRASPGRARIGVSLAADGEEFRLLASEALATLAEAFDVPCDGEALTLARRISSEAAERVARRLLLEVTDAGADAGAYEWPTDMLEAVGPRLAPTAAERVASRLVEAMTHTRDSHQLARLARGLSAVGAGLSAAMSQRAAEWLVEVMTHAGDLDDLCRLAGGLEAVRNWLPTAVAARAFATLSGAGNAFEIVRLARNLEQVGPRLPAPDADRATERIVAAMSRMSDRGALETLTRGLEAVVPRLTASATVRAAEQLAASLARTRVAVAIRALAGGLRAIAQRLPAADVEHFVERAADRLIEAMLEACKPDDLRCLAEGLGELGPLLTPGCRRGAARRAGYRPDPRRIAATGPGPGGARSATGGVRRPSASPSGSSSGSSRRLPAPANRTTCGTWPRRSRRSCRGCRRSPPRASPGG